MWKTISPYLPDLMTVLQAIIAFAVPFGISRFFKWVHSFEKE